MAVQLWVGSLNFVSNNDSNDFVRCKFHHNLHISGEYLPFGYKRKCRRRNCRKSKEENDFRSSYNSENGHHRTQSFVKN